MVLPGDSVSLKRFGRMDPTSQRVLTFQVVGRPAVYATHQEIRVKDGEQIRVFYAYAKGDEVWLLSGFIKKTQKTPPAEIRKALRIRKELGL